MVETVTWRRSQRTLAFDEIGHDMLRPKPGLKEYVWSKLNEAILNDNVNIYCKWLLSTAEKGYVQCFLPPKMYVWSSDLFLGWYKSLRRFGMLLKPYHIDMRWKGLIKPIKCDTWCMGQSQAMSSMWTKDKYRPLMSFLDEIILLGENGTFPLRFVDPYMWIWYWLHQTFTCKVELSEQNETAFCLILDNTNIMILTAWDMHARSKYIHDVLSSLTYYYFFFFFY